MRRVAALLTVAALLAAGPPEVRAQPAGKLYRVGYIGTTAPGPNLAAFKRAMRDLGLVEGVNVVYEQRFADGHMQRVPQLVVEVLATKPDVLVVASTAGAAAAKRATSTVPIVFASVFDPVASGLVQSLARPGGNVTGATVDVGGSGAAAKWIELLLEAAPAVTRVAVLWNSANPASARSASDLQAAARSYAVTLELHDVNGRAAFDDVLDRIAAGGAQGIVVANDPVFTANRDRLVRFATARRLPAMYYYRLFPDAGGLMSYGGSVEDSYRRAAGHVDKILKGARPADLPVDQPTRFELVVNQRAAKAIGLKLPPPLLVRADHVIE